MNESIDLIKFKLNIIIDQLNDLDENIRENHLENEQFYLDFLDKLNTISVK